MSYKIDVIESRDNPLTGRKEIKFRVDHPKSGTPNRFELKQKLAALQTADENLVFIKNIRTNFGSRFVTGRADIYEDEQNAKKFEPDYVRIRNLPKDQREPEYKKLRELRKKKKAKGAV